MKRKWQIRRQCSPTADAERRWDQAYQHLLAWTASSEPVSAPLPRLCSPTKGAAKHENNSDLRSGINRSASAGTNDRATAGASESSPSSLRKNPFEHLEWHLLTTASCCFYVRPSSRPAACRARKTLFPQTARYPSRRLFMQRIYDLEHSRSTMFVQRTGRRLKTTCPQRSPDFVLELTQKYSPS